MDPDRIIRAGGRGRYPRRGDTEVFIIPRWEFFTLFTDLRNRESVISFRDGFFGKQREHEHVSHDTHPSYRSSGKKRHIAPDALHTQWDDHHPSYRDRRGDIDERKSERITGELYHLGNVRHSRGNAHGPDALHFDIRMDIHHRSGSRELITPHLYASHEVGTVCIRPIEERLKM